VLIEKGKIYSRLKKNQACDMEYPVLLTSGIVVAALYLPGLVVPAAILTAAYAIDSLVLKYQHNRPEVYILDD
jgi:hypothetical protein